MCDLAKAQVLFDFFIYKLNSFIADFKSFCIVILLGALQHTEFSIKLVFLCSFSYFERINKISKIDKIDTMDLKIDKYRLLTTFFFIDFHRFPIKSTVFLSILSNVVDYRFYRLVRPGLITISVDARRLGYQLKGWAPCGFLFGLVTVTCGYIIV